MGRPASPVWQSVALVCATALLVSGCASASTSTSASADGRKLVSQLCGRCHPLDRVNGAKKDRAGWTATVGRMRSHGLQVDDDQAQAIVDYLTKRDGGS